MASSAARRGEHGVSVSVNNLEIPTIGLLNGPGSHSGIVLMCDITLAADDAAIFDLHYDIGRCPPTAFTMPSRNCSGSSVRPTPCSPGGDQREAGAGVGMVNEVVPRERLVERAYQIADHIMTQPRTTRRLTIQHIRSTVEAADRQRR